MKKLFNNKSGATGIEYAVMAFFLSIVIIGAIATVGSGTKEKYTEVGEKLESAFQPASGSKNNNSGTTNTR